jgi:acetyl esterase/lipase
MGFSAGGHLAASLTTRFDAKVYDRVDAADDLSARPDLSALIYPVVSMVDGPVHGGSRKQLLGPSPTPEQIALYSPDQNVTDRVPPVFLLHAADDKTVPVANSLMMFTALKAKAIPDRDAHLRGGRPRLWPARHRRQAGRRLAGPVRDLRQAARSVKPSAHPGVRRDERKF